MAETEKNPQQDPEKESIPPRDKEIRHVARKLVEDKIAERGADLDTSTDEKDKALAIYRKLASENPKTGLAGDKKIRMPDITFSDDEGNVLLALKKDEHYLGSVIEVTPDGKLVCGFKDKDDNDMYDEDGDLITVNFDRNTVLDAQLHSARRDVADHFSGNEYALFNRYAESLPQNDSPLPAGPDSDDLVDKVAEAHEMLRVADVQAFIDELPDEDKDDAAIAAAMDIFKDRKLADPKEFAAIIRASGNDEGEFAAKINAIDGDVAGWNEELGKLADPDGADKATKDDLEAKIAAADAKRATYEKGAQILEDVREPEPPPGPEDKEPNAEVTERVSKELTAQIDGLKRILDSYKVAGEGGQLVYRENLTKSEQNAIRHAELMVAELALADKAVGIIGPLQRAAALKNLENVYKEEFKSMPVPKGVKQMLKDEDFAEQVSDAKDAVQSIMELSDDDMEKLDEPGGWEALAQSEKYAAKEDEILQKTYGDVSKTELYQIMDDVNRSYQNIDDAKFRHRMWEFVKKNPGKRAGILAMILASVGVAIAAVPVVATLSAVGAAGKAMH